MRDRHAAHVTTPGAPELQATLAAMVRAGNEVAVLETTSHALALDRVLGVALDAAVFTNLTHEHLELHGTFEAYRAAKLRLFRGASRGSAGSDRRPTGRTAMGTRSRPSAGGPWPKVAIVNRDDPAASWFEAAAHEAGARIVTYGADAGGRRPGDRRSRRTRAAFASRYAAPSGSAALELRLAGRFNVHNALAVVALGEGAGPRSGGGPRRARVRRGRPGPDGADRRAGQPFAVVVDYAHSPASLTGVLDLLAPIAAAGGGGLIAVFGSGGERDTAKRGADGPDRGGALPPGRRHRRGSARRGPRARSSRRSCAGAEAAGGRRGVDVLAIPDRREAIAAAFERAAPGDVVLLAGKGHEASILYADGPIPWDEAAEARLALAAMGYGER